MIYSFDSTKESYGTVDFESNSTRDKQFLKQINNASVITFL